MKKLLALGFIGVLGLGAGALASPNPTNSTTLPPSAIDCSQFQKLNGAWIEKGTAQVNLGNNQQISLANQPIRPGTMRGGYDLYTSLQSNCSGNGSD